MSRTRDAWCDRYAAFTARKTQLAASAALPPYVTAFDAPDPDLLAIGNDWSRALFDGPFYVSPPRDPARPACSLVFVQSADGNTGADDPGTLGGGDTDKHLIYEGLSRIAADAVLAGAETVRGAEVIFSVWHPQLVALRAAMGLPRHPLQIVATMRGLVVDDVLLLNVPEVDAVVLTIASGMRLMEGALRERPWVRPVVMDAADHLGRAFDLLRGMGTTRLSCVGGRSLAAHLLAADLVDDVYLTTAPQTGGTPGTPLFQRPWNGRAIVRKYGTGADTGVVFEHLVRGTHQRPA